MRLQNKSQTNDSETDAVIITPSLNLCYITELREGNHDNRICGAGNSTLRLYTDVNLRNDIKIGTRVYPVYCTTCRATEHLYPAVLTEI